MDRPFCLIVHRSVHAIRVPRRRRSDVRVFRVILTVYRVVKGISKGLRCIRLLHSVRTIVHLFRMRRPPPVVKRPPGNFAFALQTEGGKFIIAIGARPL